MKSSVSIQIYFKVGRRLRLSSPKWSRGMRSKLVYFYSIYGLEFASNVAFPELTPATAFGAECSFELMPAGVPTPRDSAWFHHQWNVEGADGEEDPWLCFGHRKGGYLLRFPSCG